MPLTAVELVKAKLNMIRQQSDDINHLFCDFVVKEVEAIDKIDHLEPRELTEVNARLDKASAWLTVQYEESCRIITRIKNVPRPQPSYERRLLSMPEFSDSESTQAFIENGESPTSESPQAFPENGESPSSESPQASSKNCESQPSESPQASSKNGESPTSESPQAFTGSGESLTSESPLSFIENGESPISESPEVSSKNGESPSSESPKASSKDGESQASESPQASSENGEYQASESAQASTENDESHDRQPSQASTENDVHKLAYSLGYSIQDTTQDPLSAKEEQENKIKMLGESLHNLVRCELDSLETKLLQTIDNFSNTLERQRREIQNISDHAMYVLSAYVDGRSLEQTVVELNSRLYALESTTHSFIKYHERNSAAGHAKKPDSPVQLLVNNIDNPDSPVPLLVNNIDNPDSPVPLLVNNIDNPDSPVPLLVNNIDNPDSPVQLLVNNIDNPDSPVPLLVNNIDNPDSPVPLLVNNIDNPDSPVPLLVNNIDNPDSPVPLLVNNENPDISHPSPLHTNASGNRVTATTNRNNIDCKD